jgi:hypothetical protein
MRGPWTFTTYSLAFLSESSISYAYPIATATKIGGPGGNRTLVRKTFTHIVFKCVVSSLNSTDKERDDTVYHNVARINPPPTSFVSP